MNYAVIETGGKQYKINKGDTITVERLPEDQGKIVSFDKVLLAVEDGNVTIGTPYIPNAVVNAKIVDNLKGDKIRVSKFRAKSKYRRVTGHRQALTQVEIADIKVNGKVVEKDKKK